MKEKLKSFLADDALYSAGIVLLVGIGGFVLGQLSAVQTARHNSSSVNTLSLCPTPVLPLPTTVTAPASPSGLVANHITTAAGEGVTPSQYVASKSGTRYHHVTCPGAKQIKDANKIFFDTIQQAEAAGYSKAANCNR